MKRKLLIMKRLVSMAITITFVLLALIGCNKDGKTATNSTAKKSSINFIVTDYNGNYEDGRKTENQMVKTAIEKKYKEDTKEEIDLQFISYVSAIIGTRFNSIFANPSERKKYDAFSTYYPWGQFSNYANMPNLIEPLDEILNSYGKELLSKIPKTAWDAVKINGKIMAIPDVRPQISYTAYTRMDYVKKWNKDRGHTPNNDVPTTLEDLESYFEYVKTKLLKTPIADEFINLDKWLAGSFGLTYETYLDENGRVWSKAFNPNFIPYMETLKRWYAKGYLPADFTSMNWEKSANLFKTNMTSTVITYIAAPVNMAQTMANAFSGAEIAHLPMPKVTINGKLIEAVAPVESEVKGVVFILKGATNKENVVKYFNWKISKQENEIMATQGINGIHYSFDKATGALETKEKYIDPTIKGYAGLYSGGHQFDIYPKLNVRSDDPVLQNALEMVNKTETDLDLLKKAPSPNIVKNVVLSSTEQTVYYTFLNKLNSIRNKFISDPNVKTADFVASINEKDGLRDKFLPLQKIYEEKINK